MFARTRLACLLRSASLRCLVGCCLVSAAFHVCDFPSAPVAALPLGAARTVRGGQSCFQSFTNACPYAASGAWGTYGDQTSCRAIPCVYPNGAGAANCPTGAVYDSLGGNPDYQDCESGSGYEGKTSGSDYDCGQITYCSGPGPNNCASGTWGNQLRCKNSGPNQIYDVPTCAPNSTSPECGDGACLRLDARLLAIAKVNGLINLLN